MRRQGHADTRPVISIDFSGERLGQWRKPGPQFGRHEKNLPQIQKFGGGVSWN